MHATGENSSDVATGANFVTAEAIRLESLQHHWNNSRVSSETQALLPEGMEAYHTVQHLARAVATKLPAEKQSLVEVLHAFLAALKFEHEGRAQLVSRPNA